MFPHFVNPVKTKDSDGNRACDYGSIVSEAFANREAHSSALIVPGKKMKDGSIHLSAAQKQSALVWEGD